MVCFTWNFQYFNDSIFRKNSVPQIFPRYYPSLEELKEGELCKHWVAGWFSTSMDFLRPQESNTWQGTWKAGSLQMTKWFGLPRQFQSHDTGMAAWSTELRRILNLKAGHNKFVLSAIEADKFTTRKTVQLPHYKQDKPDSNQDYLISSLVLMNRIERSLLVFLFVFFHFKLIPEFFK